MTHRTASWPRLAALALGTLTLAGCAGSRTDLPEYRPDISGTWVLDPALSNDSAALALAFADSADPRLRAGRRGRLPPSATWSRSDTLYRASDPVRAARLALATVREPAARLTIAATDTLVTFGFGAGDDVALSTAWREAAGPWGDGRGWQLRARWREGRLEVERRQPQDDGVTLNEYYSRSPGADRLVVWTVIDVLNEELSVRRVYRLAPAGQG